MVFGQMITIVHFCTGDLQEFSSLINSHRKLTGYNGKQNASVKLNTSDLITFVLTCFYMLNTNTQTHSHIDH